MNQRFQIEDLKVQDASGVVFRALDTETGGTVAVRRFFPFGAEGGGLNKDEQAAYNVAVERLAQVSHPALRRIICGGCDPVDGMPYIATEWVSGHSVLDVMAQHPLSPEAAARIVTKALEVCERLSEALTEQATWIETDLKTIVVGSADSGREVTFWISPSNWLGRHEASQRGLDSILHLATDLVGWSGLHSNQLPPGGFTDWLNWLRAHTATASLTEARKRLTAAISGESPVANRATARPKPTRPAKVVLKKKKKKSPGPMMLAGVGILAVMGGGGWWAVQRNQASLEKLNTAKLNLPEVITVGEKSEVAQFDADNLPLAEPPGAEMESESSGEISADEATRRALAMSTAAPPASGEPAASTARIQSEISEPGSVFTPNDPDLLLAQAGKLVALEGTFEKIDFSNSRKTMYVMFSKSAQPRDARGGILVGSAPADLTESALAPLIGRKIRLRGEVQVDTIGQGKRPVIMIGNRQAIETVE